MRQWSSFKKLKKIFVIFLILSTCSVMIYSVNSKDFYLNLFKSGQEAFSKKNYEKAVQDFRIAEFGLEGANGVINELYVYYSLSFFNLQRMKETREVLEKLNSLQKQQKIENLNFPKALIEDYLIMKYALERNPGNLLRKFSFDIKFFKIFLNLDNESIRSLSQKQKMLKKIQKDDVCNNFLTSVIDFKEKKYSKVIKNLSKLVESFQIKLSVTRDKICWYLALSYYELGNYDKILEIFQKISDQKIIEQLQILLKENEKKKDNSEIRKNVQSRL